MMPFSTYLADIDFIGLFLLIVGVAVIIFVLILRGTIDLSDLLEEPGTGKASISRFQFLLFTFVIAGVWLFLSFQSGSMVDVPEHVLWLLGISGGSYGASKAIQTWGASGAGTTKTTTTTTTPAAATANAQLGTTGAGSAQTDQNG
jgi:hypothetical protein